MPNEFNQKIIEEFRANGGRVGGPFEGARLLLLTTTGARSGTPHTTPVAYLPDGGDRLLVIASAGGADHNPAWYHNLVANPRVTVEDGTFTYEARAAVINGAERDRLFARAVEADPGWAEYRAATSRVIPVVALEQFEGGPASSTASHGRTLKLIHDAFRRELELVRAEIAASGPGGVGAQLRVNCLAFCGGLHHHHTMEDTALFPTLAERNPELGETLERLDREHRSIAALLDELHEVISTDNVDSQKVLAEIDRLAAELEEHLAYEEEWLIPVLDELS
ncbi:nitroreductase/quinone reductase family protein [Halostreptopolyspora alba]|uniref:Nitroreductase family deazaflavin-dependent oxidoreductase n=1 Tax=Halostreptopolyspora alba TaxID=2487137 RepID=A0A3N0EHV7_9ACTN|nr:nitroreductase family deazaflavin-dependent oxidoreductase [Nocardiopsaceae bacterium YIM 96095]